MRRLLLASVVCCDLSCAGSVDRFALRRVVPSAGADADLDRACALGAAFGQALAGVGPGARAPHLALLIADTTAGFCAEGEAWEAELDAGRGLRAPAPDLGEVEDANLREARAHRQAAGRFLSAWRHLEAEYGPVGEGCPRLPGDEGVLYLLGLYAGVNALLHDRAGGGTLGVPMDIPAAVARGSDCLDDARWWHAPRAMRAAADAMVPGLAPRGVDPWVALEAAAAASDPTGVRLGRGLQVLIAANAGRSGDVAHGLRAHAAALSSNPADPAWALLDEYARLVSLHEADLVWTAAAGHRAPALGPLPGDARAAPAGPEDPFAGDDPFAASPERAP
jgi:hypothetical protein